MTLRDIINFLIDKKFITAKTKDKQYGAADLEQPNFWSMKTPQGNFMRRQLQLGPQDKYSAFLPPEEYDQEYLDAFIKRKRDPVFIQTEPDMWTRPRAGAMPQKSRQYWKDYEDQILNLLGPLGKDF